MFYILRMNKWSSSTNIYGIRNTFDSSFVELSMNNFRFFCVSVDVQFQNFELFVLSFEFHHLHSSLFIYDKYLLTGERIVPTSVTIIFVHIQLFRLKIKYAKKRRINIEAMSMIIII